MKRAAVRSNIGSIQTNATTRISNIIKHCELELFERSVV